VSDERSAVQAAQRRARDKAIRRGKLRTKPGGAYSTTHLAMFGRLKPELTYQRAGNSVRSQVRTAAFVFSLFVTEILAAR
jgi:hypothetical protein